MDSSLKRKVKTECLRGTPANRRHRCGCSGCMRHRSNKARRAAAKKVVRMRELRERIGRPGSKD